MGDGVEQFRVEYRARMAGKPYNGPLHAAAILALGLLGAGLYARRARRVKPAEWLAVPAGLLFANVVEWGLHRYVLHVPRKGLLFAYARHTLNHHRFFTRERMTYDSVDDYRIVFFPPGAVLASIATGALLGSVVRRVWSRNAGTLFAATSTGSYVMYELFHWCAHLPESDVLARVPLINTMRRNHAVHHDLRNMIDVNLNLTLPISDWLFGTSDLDRDLLGTLLNGYDEKHLKAVS